MKRLLTITVLSLITTSGLALAGEPRRALERSGRAPAFRCPIHGDDPDHPLPVDVRDALGLPGDGVAAAARAAFLTLTHPGAPRDRSRDGSWIVSAIRDNHDDGALALRDHACGHHLGRRTVDVTLHYATPTPSDSLSYGRVFVARYRLPDGHVRYLIWQVMH